MFTSIGSLGSSNLKTAGHEITLSVPRTVQVGNFILMWIAWEQDYYSGVGPEGSVIPNLMAEDTAGNIWATLTSYMYEANVGLLICQVKTALGTGDVITVRHRSNLYHAKAISAWEFGISNPLSVWARVDRFPEGGGITAGDTVGFAAPRGGLWIYGAAEIGPNSDVWTMDADYTQIDPDGTTGGADATNISVRGAFRIFDGTTDSFTWSNAGGARLLDNFLLTLHEVPYVSGFPLMPILDDFNRGDRDPLDGIWLDGFDTNCWPTYGARNMRIVGNKAAISLAGGGAGGQATAQDTSKCYREVYATLSTTGNIIIAQDATGCGNHADADSRGIEWWPFVDSNGHGGPGGSVSAYLDFGEIGFTGYRADVGLKCWVRPADGYKLGLQRDSRDLSVLHAWTDRGGGWKWMGAMVQTAFPTTAGAWTISGWGDVLTRIDDFGGGGDECPHYWANMNWRSATRQKTATRALLNPGH